jgi:hypothetical protein
MIIAKAKLCIAALAAVFCAATPAAFAQDRGHPGGAAFHFFNAITGQTQEINREAMGVYESAPRAGTCAERRERFLAIPPDALRFARYSRDIYTDEHGAQMQAANLTTLDLGNGRTAYYHPAGRRYAELRIDPDRQQAVVIFQGTRLAVGSDISTDVLSFIGVETPYYAWAASLVAQIARDHPGMAVIVTGDSLGGGLGLYAVLRNPGVSAFVFNPAGLSQLTWADATAAERARTNAAVTVMSTRGWFRIEPVTALSLAGRSVLPGHIFVVRAGVLVSPMLHSAKTMVAAIERVASTHAAGTVCDGDLGILAN